MTKTKNFHVALLHTITVVLPLPGSDCKKDDEPARESGYNLKVQNVLGVTGIAAFIETSTTAPTITLQLFGTP